MASCSNASGNLPFQHEPLNQSIVPETSMVCIRLIQVLPELSEKDGFIQCIVRHAILPPSKMSYNGKNINAEGTPEEDNTAMDEADYEPEPILLGKNGAPNEPLPSYSCLSYTWGDPNALFTILMNGRPCQVRKNLWDFLGMARTQLDDKTFWIDALCIDQENTAERNVQVQYMGNIFYRATCVIAWLGFDYEISQALLRLNYAAKDETFDPYALYEDPGRRGLSRSIDSDTFAHEYLNPSSSSRSLHEIDDNSVFNESSLSTWDTHDRKHPLNDLSGKVEKVLECITEHEYWTRAWVTQEILLANRAVIVSGFTAHSLMSLARKWRNNVLHHSDKPFENLVDIVLQKKSSRTKTNALSSSGLVNLLHRFRNKDCAIRRDRVYSLLALCQEGKNLIVDYNVSDQEVMRQVLGLRPEAMCFCSAAIVSHALGPWLSSEISDDDKPLVETYMLARTLQSAVCQSCSNWVPFSWTRKKGLVFCLGTNCADLQGHLFLEYTGHLSRSIPTDSNTNSNNSESNDTSTSLPSISPDPCIHVLAQHRETNKSTLLTSPSTFPSAITFTPTPWSNIHLARFTFRGLVMILHRDLATSDLGLSACKNMWPVEGDEASGNSGTGLRFCE